MSDYHRLAAAVRERRIALGLRQVDVEGRGGPGQGTIRNIEQVSRSSYAVRTMASLERALDWQPGSVAAILVGGDPVPAGSGTQPLDEVERLQAEVALLRAEVEVLRMTVRMMGGAA